MRTLHTIPEVRGALAGHRRAGEVIGLVPTMGGLHDGHLSLFRRARAECDVVVASLFVNPTQFDDPRDLEAYPGDEEQDARQAAEWGGTTCSRQAPRSSIPRALPRRCPWPG